MDVERQGDQVTGLYLTGPTNLVAKGEIFDEELVLPKGGRSWVPLRVDSSKATLGAQRPEGPCPAGVPISREMGRKRPGLRPWTPGFIAARSHSLGLGIVVFENGRGTISSGMLRSIWDAFSGKIC